MTKDEIILFIRESTPERLADMHKICYDKQAGLNKRRDRLLIIILILMFLYFIASKANVTTLQIGPLNFTDLSMIEKLIPAVYAYILFQFVAITAHRADNQIVLEIVTKKLFVDPIKYEGLKENIMDRFYRLLLPVSFEGEVFSISKESRRSIADKIFIFPLWIIVLMPFVFEILIVHNAITQHWDNIITKISVVLSIWIFMAMVHFSGKRQKRNYKDDVLTAQYYASKDFPEKFFDPHKE